MSKNSKMKRVFYFNITYGCNSNCVFCYSHNTKHDSKIYNEIKIEELFCYLDGYKINLDDRIVINGGEPLLHSKIYEILIGLKKYNCEIIIYTNGRLLSNYDFSKLSDKFRFVIPIHGNEFIHDKITRIKGSYRESINGLNSLINGTSCNVDIKIIINNEIITDKIFEDFIESLEYVPFNNAVHITKMADTIVSNKNNCSSINNDVAAFYTNKLFKYFKSRNCKMKIFDTCIKDIDLLKYESPISFKENIIVYFKDNRQFRKIPIHKANYDCKKNCDYCDKCISALTEYKVLEYYNKKFFENME